MLTQLTPHLSFSVKDQLVTGYRHYSEIPVNSYIRNYCIKTSIKVFYLNIKKKYSTAEIMLWSCWLSRNAVTGIKHFSVLNEMGAKGTVWKTSPRLTCDAKSLSWHRCILQHCQFLLFNHQILENVQGM